MDIKLDIYAVYKAGLQSALDPFDQKNSAAAAACAKAGLAKVTMA